jgi:hypothetical protein
MKEKAMPSSVTVAIVVRKEGKDITVGRVRISRQDVEAAKEIWDSGEFTAERESWRNRKGTKLFISDGDRRYPQKPLLKIACRKQVKELSERLKPQNVRFKRMLLDNLHKATGGYQVIGVQDGLTALGYTVKKLNGPLPMPEVEPPSTPESSDVNPPPPRVKVEEYRVLRDTSLARRLKLLHDNRCQLCGNTITLGDGTTYSEGHHIRPLGSPDNGTDEAANILILCPNCHVLCDYRAIRLDMKNIRLHPKHKIGQRFIDYHNSQLQT